MSYLETLNSHNTQIQNLINKANSLPDAGGSGGGSGGVCPQLTIKGEIGPHILFGAAPTLTKVVYYSNGSLQELTAFDSSNWEIGLEWNILETPYVLNNVDVGAPIFVEGYDADGGGQPNFYAGANVANIAISTKNTGSIMAVFKVISTDNAEIYLLVE